MPVAWEVPAWGARIRCGGGGGSSQAGRVGAEPWREGCIDCASFARERTRGKPCARECERGRRAAPHCLVSSSILRTAPSSLPRLPLFSSARSVSLRGGVLLPYSRPWYLSVLLSFLPRSRRVLALLLFPSLFPLGQPQRVQPIFSRPARRDQCRHCMH